MRSPAGMADSYNTPCLPGPNRSETGDGHGQVQGTNGNDTITGTAFDDTIAPLLGQDTVDGGAGYDTLTVDYSSLTDAYWYSTMSLQADGSWSGAVTGGASSAPNSVAFSNVEQVKFAATQAADYMTVDLGTLKPDKSRMSLDGAGGDDTLSVLGSQLTGRLTLAVDANGKAKANFGALAGWDNYDVALGKSAGNTLVLGMGDDAVTSTGGQDTIDGGMGQDRWTGLYQNSTTDMNFFFSTGTETATVTTGGTTLAEIKNVEDFSLQTGSGDDNVIMFEGAGAFDGGGGYDQISLNQFGASAPMRYEVDVAGAAFLTGNATVLGGGDTIVFADYENVVLGGSAGGDQFVVDASQQLLSSFDMQIYMAGGDGDDSLTLTLAAQGAVVVRQTADGAGFVDGLGTNTVIWTGLEAMTVTLGAGDDMVDFAVASDSLVVDGGAGFDTIDFGNAVADITFDLGKTTAQFADDLLVTAQHLEGVIGSAHDDSFTDSVASDWVRGGDGNDLIQSSAASNAGFDAFDGGDGYDVIDYYYAASAVYVSLAITNAQTTGGGGTDTLTGFEVLGGSQFSDILTGSAANDSLLGHDGDDLLEGGTGNDYLDGGAGIDTARYSSAASAVMVKLTLGFQDTGGAGSDTLSSIENLTGSNYSDSLGGNASANRLTGLRGADTLTGLGGADAFAYSSKLDSTISSYDTITDFSRAQGDKIDLQGVDAKDGTFDPIRVNDAFTWIGTDAFHGVSGELREGAVRGGGYFLYGDTNGDKIADLAIFVNVSTPLLSTDILL